MTASSPARTATAPPPARMRIGVYTRGTEPYSILGYRRAVVRAMDGPGLDFVEVDGRGCPSDLDLLWDPGLGMRRVPALLLRTDARVVATVHGLRAHSLPLAEAARGWWERARTAATMAGVRRDWRRLGGRVAAVICVSRFGAAEAADALGLPPSRVFAIHHGVDHEVFGPEGPRAGRERPFFLMVTQYQPKKNVERVLHAYAGLPRADRPELVVVAAGMPRRPVPDGVTVVRSALDHQEIAALYRAALAFLCPSLHETFGMPLLEAMACGCPVLTSGVTACPEVAGDVALLVDPRDEAAIAAGMRRLANEPDLRAELRERGISRAGAFTWQRSARHHLEVFRSAVEAPR